MPRKAKSESLFQTILSWVLTSVLLLLALIMLLSKVNIHGSFQTFLVQSGSMSPTIKTGNLIIVKPAPIYKVGDIITFRNSNNQKITHRIVNIKVENNFQKIYTKGDANKVNDDGYILANQIIGKVRYQIPYLGKLVYFSKTLPGLMLLIVLPASIIVLGEIKKIFKSLTQSLSC